MKRRGFSNEAVRRIREAYRTVYRQGLSLEEAIAELEARAAEQDELEPFVASLQSGSRGLIR